MPADCQGTATLGTNYCVKQPKYQDIGEDPDGVLGMCSGDCDTDSDCDSGLQCWQRDSNHLIYVRVESGPNSCSGKVSVGIKISNNYA